MRRYLVPLWLMFVSLSTLLAAGGPDSEPTRSALDVALLDALVTQSLQIADEKDPLRRAGGSAAVADELAEAVQRANERGDHAQVIKLSQYLALILDRGVKHNVDQLDPQNLDPARLAAWRGLSERPEVIRKTLGDTLPPPGFSKGDWPPGGEFKKGPKGPPDKWGDKWGEKGKKDKGKWDDKKGKWDDKKGKWDDKKDKWGDDHGPPKKGKGFGPGGPGPGGGPRQVHLWQTPRPEPEAGEWALTFPSPPCQTARRRPAGPRGPRRGAPRRRTRGRRPPPPRS